MSLFRRPSSGNRGATGAQGPSGSAGADGASAYEVAVSNGFVGTEQDWLDSLEEPVPYAEAIDFVGDNLIYKGWARLVSGGPNPPTASAVWRIQRITITGDDIDKHWADGDALFNNVWDNRLSLDYS